MTTPDPAITAAVDAYAADHLLDPGLRSAVDAAAANSTAAGLPEIRISTMQGAQLMLLARAVNARSILEIGTLGGFSTIFLANGLAEGGRVLTLELVELHAQTARTNLDAAGLAERVEVRQGDALETLGQLRDAASQGEPGSPPFDFVFIDADKQRIPEYLDHAVRLARPGALIVVDNTVRRGNLLDGESEDVSVRGVRRLHEMLQDDPRVSAATIQTIGSKGWDGYTMVHVAW